MTLSEGYVIVIVCPPLSWLFCLHLNEGLLGWIYFTNTSVLGFIIFSYLAVSFFLPSFSELQVLKKTCFLFKHWFKNNLKKFQKCKQEKNKWPEWVKRFVLVIWLRLEPSADFSTFLITTSPAPAPAWLFCARSSLCCRSSWRRVSRSFSLWSRV